MACNLRILRAASLLVLLAVAPVRGEEEEHMVEAVPPGDYWYAMRTEDGAAVGYARLVVVRRSDGGLGIDWTLKIAHGGNYEETRRLTVDRDGRLLESEHRAFDNLVCAGRRDGDAWRITVVEDGKVVERETEPPPADATTGMGFVFAAAVPREEGGTLTFVELNEADALKPIGRVRYTWEGTAEGEGEVASGPVHRIRIHKPTGKDLPLTIAEDGRILTVDWGSLDMALSPTSTEGLYTAHVPLLTVREAGAQLVLEGDVAGFTPDEVYDHFTKPDLLATFWAPEAEVDLRVGGAYTLSWPGPGWTLLGEVLEADRGHRLAFRWRWKHRPDAPDQRVVLDLAPAEGGGCRVRITHGPYRDTEADAAEREGHVQGWETAFSRLVALR